ncbi:MAG: FeoA family protein [Steroidobacteraceae bacterium]
MDAIADHNDLLLSALRKGDRAVVVAVVEDGESLGDSSASTIARRLLELGFVPGAELEVVATIWPGGDPLAVRVGSSMFALRKREAQSVRVRRSTGSGADPGASESADPGARTGTAARVTGAH